MDQLQIDMFNTICCGSNLQCIPPSVPEGDIPMVYDAHSGYYRGSVILVGSDPFSISNVILEDPVLFPTLTSEIFGNVLYINAIKTLSTVDGSDLTFTITNPCGSITVTRFLNLP